MHPENPGNQEGGEVGAEAVDKPVGSSLNEPPSKTWRDPTLSRTPPSVIAAVLAMDQLGVPRTEIAKREKISTSTLYQIIKQGDHIDPAIVERVKQRYAAHWWITGERALQGITEDKVKAASASQLGVLAAISTDKALLLEGKPTSRVEFQSMDDREAAGKISDLERELEGWKSGSILNGDVSSVGEGGDMAGDEGIAPTE